MQLLTDFTWNSIELLDGASPQPQGSSTSFAVLVAKCPVTLADLRLAVLPRNEPLLE